jgi:dTMP kinase
MSEKIGQIIKLEGNDGTGKSTQAGLMHEKLGSRGIRSFIFAEPALDPKDGFGEEDVLMAKELRAIVKNRNLTRSPITDLLIFSAARHETWTQKVRPRLLRGETGITARGDESTHAYQGYGDGIDPELIDYMTGVVTDELYRTSTISVVLCLDDEIERLERIASRGPLDTPDQFEDRPDDYLERVNNAYPKIAKARGIPIVSASGTPDEVHERIWTIVEPKLHSA